MTVESIRYMTVAHVCDWNFWRGRFQNRTTEVDERKDSEHEQSAIIAFQSSRYQCSTGQTFTYLQPSTSH